MSTLKTHNLQSPDAASANIALAPNAGMVVAGFTTFTDHVKIDDGPVLEKSTSNSALQITTPTGYVQVGSHNSSYAHFYTDRGRYFFNKKLVVNDGVISSYDEDLVLATNSGNDEHVTIKTDGKMGLGTNNPNADFHIKSSFPAIRFEDDSDYSQIDANGGSLRLLADAGNASSDSKMQFSVDGSEKFRIESDGDFRLSSGDAGTNYGWIRGWESGTGNLIFSADHSTTGTNGSSIIFKTRGDEKLRILHEGNIGIGTTNPTEQLVIYKGVGGNPSGNATFAMRSDTSSTHMHLDARGTNASSMIYFRSGTAYDAFLQLKHNYSGDHYLRYCHNGSAAETFRIHSTGALGLGGANYGTAGQVLKSNGSSAVPSWSGGAQRVLEVVASPCDGSTISSSNGDVTFQNVTGVQNLSTTFTDVTGSKITYTPPTGTTQVIYEFNFQMSRLDALAISHYRMYIAGNEVTYARSEIAAEDGCVRTTIRWIFNIGGSQNNATGRQSSWTSGKEIKLQAEDYGGSYDVQLHETNWWNGSSTDQFSMPTLSLTAIGV